MRISSGRASATATALSIALGACVSAGQAEPQAPALQRPQCASAHGVLYFEQDTATLSPASAPIIREVMERIDTCRSAGGELQRITVAAYPDRNATRPEASASIRARAAAVREALIDAGAPANKIRIETHRDTSEPSAQLMQRRAEIDVVQR